MVIRGKIRGNGSQLASYLLKKADNDNVRILDIKGTTQPNDLKNALLEMSLTSELTKTDAGLYHAQICPAYDEDKAMTYQDWLRSAEIMEEELGFTGQKRVMVLHEKKDKTHAHIVWERFDHETGVMKSNKHSRLAQDRARVKMEREFKQERTPERSVNRADMKEALTLLWKNSGNAQEFLSFAKEQGYLIGAGTQRPYIVVDKNGRSFDLVRQLQSIKTKDVRERFRHTKLTQEKKLIEIIRKQQKEQQERKSQSLQQKERVISRKDLSAHFIQNTTMVDAQKDKIPNRSMKTSFTVKGSDQAQSIKDLKTIIDKAADIERIKAELKEELRKTRLERAKKFRQNERDW